MIWEELDRSGIDLSGLLATMYREARRQGSVVEFGVKDGNSTLCLLEGVRDYSPTGHVTSWDVESCQEAKRRIAEAGLADYWTFHQADARTCRFAASLFFIDAGHSFAEAWEETRLAANLGASTILLHDVIWDPPVQSAIDQFRASRPGQWSYERIHTKWGLGILQRTG